MMSIKYRIPVSENPAGANIYENCFYVCRYCSQARGTTPQVDQLEHRLLDPCQDAWGHFFELDGDEIRARDGNADAIYTLETYQLNEPRKVELRRSRRKTLEEAIAVVREVPPLRDELLAKAIAQADDTLVELAWKLRGCLIPAWRDLERFVPIPVDADAECACGHRRHHSLPDVLEGQVVELNVPKLVGS